MFVGGDGVPEWRLSLAPVTPTLIHNVEFAIHSSIMIVYNVIVSNDWALAE